MDRDLFMDRLLRASERCREFTTQFVTDLLPSTYAFWVLLNSSYDADLGPDEVVFPDDVQKYGSRVGPLDAEGVVSLLWRDRMVPEWIDMSVWAADEDTTYLELTCCGRFTSQSRIFSITIGLNLRLSASRAGVSGSTGICGVAGGTCREIFFGRITGRC